MNINLFLFLAKHLVAYLAPWYRESNEIVVDEKQIFEKTTDEFVDQFSLPLVRRS